MVVKIHVRNLIKISRVEIIGLGIVKSENRQLSDRQYELCIYFMKKSLTIRK